MTLTLLIATALASPCTTTATADDLTARLDAARASLGAGDVAAVRSDLAFARLAAQCLAEPIPPLLAARFHRLVGIERLASDADASAEHFRASFALDPDARLPVYPEDHPLQASLRAPFEPRPVRLRLRKSDGAVYVDGVPSTTLDRATAHFAQRQVPGSSQLDWLELRAGELPPWATARTGRASRPLRIAGAALLATSLGFTVANIASARQFDQITTSVSELRAARNRTNAFGGLAVGTGVVGVGLVGAGLTVR